MRGGVIGKRDGRTRKGVADKQLRGRREGIPHSSFYLAPLVSFRLIYSFSRHVLPKFSLCVLFSVILASPVVVFRKSRPQGRSQKFVLGVDKTVE